MKIIILKNNTLSTIVINSIETSILSNEFVEINSNETIKLLQDDDFISKLNSGQIVINDGSSDLSVLNAKKHLQPVDISLFSLSQHSHLKSEISDFNHSHTEFYTKSESDVKYPNIVHDHNDLYYEKSSVYTKTDLQTQGQSSINWNNITSIPLEYPPANHNHDSIYSNIIHSHTKSEISDFIESDYVHSSGNEIISGDKIFSGNVTIQGTITTVNSEVINLADSVILLNSDYVGSNPTENAGIEINRGSSVNASILWDEGEEKWKVGLIGSEQEISLLGHSHTEFYTKLESDAKYSLLTHDHDSRYYTKTQSDAKYSIISHSHTEFYTKLESDGKYSLLTHDHDSRYYTKTNLQTSGQSIVHWGNLTSVPTSFTPSTHIHDDRYFTESESDARYATIAHTHSDFYTKSQIDTKLSLIDFSFVSANDTSTNITGTELETLTNGSNADALHTHSGGNGSVGTLDDAYGAWGSGRTINVDWGSVQLNAQGGFAPLKLTPINYVPNQWLGGGEICVKDNELYLYDPTRSSFLSISTFGIQWSSNSNGASGYIFYGVAQTNSSTGFVAPKNGKIIGASATAQNAASASISITVNGHDRGEIWWQSGFINLQNLNININSGDVVNLYLNGSGSSRPNRPCITLFIKSRI